MEAPTPAAARLEELNRGFREDYLPYDELTAQVRGWAEAFPGLVRVQSIGETPEGRAMWLLTIGPEPDRIRPAVWIDGNMHASELCGSSVALAIAEDVLRLHLGDDDASAPYHPALSAPVRERLTDVLFYVLPRMSPDGAETVLQTGSFVRSVARENRPDDNRAYWRHADVDGDGLALYMRVEDPCGEYVAAPDEPDMMVLRTVDDPGPYYKLYPEGYIENFNGHDVPAPMYLSGTDLNRNFPWTWTDATEQVGAGPFPMSEPESRAVVEFTSTHPHIFAWLNIHTFGGVFIRPLSNHPDSAMDPGDLALYRQIGAWAEKFTGYPMVSGFEQFTYDPGTPLHGSLNSYGFRQRGCITYVVELWDLFEQLGTHREYERFVDRYSRFDRADMVRLARWDREHNHGRVVQTWTKHDHEQLGPVEVGGLDNRVGVWNPPYERVADVCRAQSTAFLHVAALTPRLAIDDVRVTRISATTEDTQEPAFRIEATVRNRGYLPTYILAGAKKLPHNESLYATFTCTDCALDPTSLGHRNIGHLAGWGRGQYRDLAPFVYSVSEGTGNVAHVSCIVHGAGRVTLRAGSCRVGYVDRVIDLSGQPHQ